MRYEDVRAMLKMVRAHGIETSDIAYGGTDKGEWVILKNSPSCTAQSILQVKELIRGQLQLEELSVEARGDGIVLQGSPAMRQGMVRAMTYGQFFGLMGTFAVSVKPFKIGYLSHFSAPFTGGGKVLIAAGVEFKLEQEMRHDAIYCSVADREVVDLAMRHERDALDDRLRRRLSGVSFFLTKYDFEMGNVSEVPEKNAANLRSALPSDVAS